MIYEEVIQIIQRLMDEAEQEKAYCDENKLYYAEAHTDGKIRAYKDILKLLTTSDEINKPWEE